MRNTIITILVCLSSCQDEANKPKRLVEKPDNVLSFEQIVRRNYDVPELKNFKDKSKYVALFTIQKRYNNFIVIEFSEIANGINLCIKQPVVASDYETYDSIRSLPFNQLCYWYIDEKAKRIKEFFSKWCIFFFK